MVRTLHPSWLRQVAEIRGPAARWDTAEKTLRPCFSTPAKRNVMSPHRILALDPRSRQTSSTLPDQGKARGTLQQDSSLLLHWPPRGAARPTSRASSSTPIPSPTTAVSTRRCTHRRFSPPPRTRISIRTRPARRGSVQCLRIRMPCTYPTGKGPRRLFGQTATRDRHPQCRYSPTRTPKMRHRATEEGRAPTTAGCNWATTRARACHRLTRSARIGGFRAKRTTHPAPCRWI